jgi:dynein heavy chain
VEKVYQFSLKWFLNLFELELRNREAVNKDIDPVEDLTERLTKIVYTRLCGSVFARDKLLISFMLALQVMNQKKTIDLELVQFFIKGPVRKQEVSDLTQREKDELRYK